MLKLEDKGALLGIILIQGATLPATWEIMFGDDSIRPPILMVFMVLVGLILYLIRSIVQRDLVYNISNSIGVFLNSVLLYLLFT